MGTCPRCRQDCPDNEMACYGGHEDCDPCTAAPKTILKTSYTLDEEKVLETMEPQLPPRKERGIKCIGKGDYGGRVYVRLPFDKGSS